MAPVDVLIGRFSDLALRAAARLPEDRVPTPAEVTRWRLEMERAIDVGHTAAALDALARRTVAGRFAGLVKLIKNRGFTESDRILLGRRLIEQKRYLDQFERQLRAGQITATAAANRSVMYSGALRATWSETRWAEYRLPGQPGVGTECLVNCRCEWQVDEAAGIARWVRHATDSCSTCRTREQLWGAVQIRKRR